MKIVACLRGAQEVLGGCGVCGRDKTNKKECTPARREAGLCSNET